MARRQYKTDFEKNKRAKVALDPVAERARLDKERLRSQKRREANALNKS
jgi:hypothetical protein